MICTHPLFFLMAASPQAFLFTVRILTIIMWKQPVKDSPVWTTYRGLYWFICGVTSSQPTRPYSQKHFTLFNSCCPCRQGMDIFTIFFNRTEPSTQPE